MAYREILAIILWSGVKTPEFYSRPLSEHHTPSTIQSAFIKTHTKNQMIEIQVPEKLIKAIHPQQVLKIKCEVDINPPGHFKTEAKSLLQPIPFHVVTFQQPDLFAGKIHALLCRPWRTRDWYDLVWYLGRETPYRLRHLKERLVQSQRWEKSQKLIHADVIDLLGKKIDETDFKAAKAEVSPFLKDPESTKIWSKEFFKDIVPSRLKPSK